jgi:hypothetical protein
LNSFKLQSFAKEMLENKSQQRKKVNNFFICIFCPLYNFLYLFISKKRGQKEPLGLLSLVFLAVLLRHASCPLQGRDVTYYSLTQIGTEVNAVLCC